MKYIIITNNKLVNEKYKDLSVHKNLAEVRFFEEKSFIEILEYVRNSVHSGHKLLTHPLTGSVKPYETPYKSVIISLDKSDMDFSSLEIIENSIEVTKKFLNDYKPRNLLEKHHMDFMTIDRHLIDSGVESINQFS